MMSANTGISKDLSLGSRKTRRDSITHKPIEPGLLPTQTWQVSTPEEQGMDSNRLLEMMQYYEKKHAKNEKMMIDSITIIRNGYIVADMYLNPFFPKDTLHAIHSCTKSIMSSLIGIAIAEGFIDGVDMPVLDILTDKRPSNIDYRWEALRLKDLLTMQTGLRSEDSFLYEWRGLFKMMATEDWVDHVLRLPMDEEPGQRFDYSNMSSFLLSVVITNTTGMDTLSFARKYLFDPLGVTDVRWEQSPKGIYAGFARMWLKPHDMAKFGLLYLQKGKWGDKQVVPAQWVEESTTAHAFPQKYRYFHDENGKVDYIKSGGVWLITKFVRPFSDGYGYQWWLDKSGNFTALGVSGQYIMVAPHENLIAVFTSKLSRLDVFQPPKMLKKFILPAIVSDKPIAPNVAAQKELALLSEPPAVPDKPMAVQQLPAIAEKISGKTYSLESNPWQYNDFQFSFLPNADYAEFSYTVKGNEEIHYQIGLDNVYRRTETDDYSYVAVGNWTAPDTFVINYELVGYTNRSQWILRFENDEIFVEEVGVTGVYTYKGKLG